MPPLHHIGLGITEFQDAWFGLIVEYGGVDQLLRLLHRLFVERASSGQESPALIPALQIFQVIFDAVWKTVLATHSR